MPRIIFKCPYIQPEQKDASAQRQRYVRYIATREGVERIDPGKSTLAATENQQKMVKQLLRDFPSSKELFEYSDYLASPTRGNASEFITRAIEDNCLELSGRDGYVNYIAKRPRAVRSGTHGLFSGGDGAVDLTQVAETVASHPGNVWLPIISLRREDAARLGYDNAKQWRELLTGLAPQMAEAMKIPNSQFRWYAAFHDEAHHPHIHMVCWSTDGRSGFLNKSGIASIKSALAKEIFRQDLTEIYRQQTQRRDELTQKSYDVLRQLIVQMKNGTLENPNIERLMLELSERLRNVKGKKQYGYLQAPLKSIVDAVVEELAKNPCVAAAYEQWYLLKENALRTYKDHLPDRVPLSKQDTFKRIRNLVVEEGVRLGEGSAVLSPVDSQEPHEATSEIPPPADDPPDTSAPEPEDESPPTVAWSARYKEARQFLYGSSDAPPDFEEAYRLLMAEAESGNALAIHCPPASSAQSVSAWRTYHRAASAGGSEYRCGQWAIWTGPSSSVPPRQAGFLA